MPYIKLTKRDKQRIAKHASPSISVLELKQKLKIKADYERIRVYMNANEIPYRSRYGHGLKKKAGVVKEGFFNIHQHETWLA